MSSYDNSSKLIFVTVSKVFKNFHKGKTKFSFYINKYNNTIDASSPYRYRNMPFSNSLQALKQYFSINMNSLKSSLNVLTTWLFWYNNNVNFEGIVVIWDPRILICRLTVEFVLDAKRRAKMTLERSKSKSKDLKWQQCLRKCSSHCNVFTFMFLAIGKWRHCNVLQCENIVNALMAGWKWYFISLDFISNDISVLGFSIIVCKICFKV